ncbi:EAL domain-containing protein [Acidovorax lacteus]|uniref:Diguanylate cyclase DosC n=1 Tax=Acidovorax lacteus TaxID=1924988 RepID=A0ABP8KYJ2_9BURK
MDALPDLQRRKLALSLTPADEALLQQLCAHIGTAAPALLAGFEQRLAAFDEAQSPLPDSARLLLHETLPQVLDRLLSGALDADYGRERCRIGAEHAQMGISPVWYLGAYAHYLTHLMPQLEASGLPPTRAVQALLKAALLDLSLALDCYVTHRDANLAEMHDHHGALAHLPMATLVVTGELDIVYANPAFGGMFGTESALLRGLPLGHVIDTMPLQALVRQAMEADVPAQTLTLQATNGQASVPALVTVQRIRHQAADAAPVRMLLVMEDRRAQAQLTRDLFNAQTVAGIGTWQVQTPGMFELTPQAARLFGWTPGVPATLQDLLGCVHPEDRVRVEQEWHAALTTGRFREECRVHTSARIRWLELRGSLEADSTRRLIHAHGTVLDITERKRAEHTMERLAFYDTLTGLPNRTNGTMLAQRLLEHARAQQCGASVMYVDLDRFKDINDAHGQSVGDAVLLSVAHRLGGLCGPRDVLCRVGSDEFICVHLREPGEDPQLQGQRIAEAISTPVTVEHLTFHTSASIGVALFPEHGDEVEHLLQQANAAMGDVKARGGGVLLYTTALGERLQRRLALGARLAQALAQGELQLYYQPKVHLPSGELSGVEALARWHTSEWGWISPAEFVPIAEERGLVGALVEWGLARASADLRQWKAQGARRLPHIAVNVSAAQMMDERFPERALQIVRSHGAEPAQIDLELTESALMNDPDRARQIASQLVAAGFRLSIDDFGTGYSSLARLQGFPVAQLKIDMSFVRTMVSDSGSHAIVATIISMARALRLQTVAEGVEEESQAQALTQLQCDEAQGYLFAKPMPADALWEQWLR